MSTNRSGPGLLRPPVILEPPLHQRHRPPVRRSSTRRYRMPRRAAAGPWVSDPHGGRRGSRRPRRSKGWSRERRASSTARRMRRRRPRPAPQARTSIGAGSSPQRRPRCGRSGERRRSARPGSAAESSRAVPAGSPSRDRDATPSPSSRPRRAWHRRRRPRLRPRPRRRPGDRRAGAERVSAPTAPAVGPVSM